MSIFKAYDIRGIYGKDLDEERAEKIGRAFATYLDAETVAVGHDMRVHSASLTEALIQGLLAQGVEVIELGLVSTPMCYFANGTLQTDGSIMVTASHNTGEWNGFKLCRENAIPLRGDTGETTEESDIGAIRRMVKNNDFACPRVGGTRRPHDIRPAYAEMLRSFCHFQGRPRVVADFANGMGSVEIEQLHDLIDLIPLYETLDGSFPNHPANPLRPENLRDATAAVRRTNAVLGAIFDGDADRCGFVDEHGEIVNMDLIIALIAGAILDERGPATVLYDLRSSWAVPEYIAEHGGQAIRCRVGHAFIKNLMRETNAIFGGELAGHYYFKENFMAESSGLALIFLLNILERTQKPFSELIAPLRRYYNSGEINTEMPNAKMVKRVLNTIRQHYANGNIFELDGVSMEEKDWWFNVRASNTEPKLRLIVEARTAELLNEKKAELLSLITQSATV